MNVWRGGADTVDADRALTANLRRAVAETGEPALRVWFPHPHVAFGRRDAQADSYGLAKERAATRGYPTIERETGGRAVAFTGAVLAIVVAEPADASDPALGERYERAIETLEAAIDELGVDVRRGEPPESFCPGTHSVQTEDGKIAGLAQRVRRDVAVVAGVVILDDGPAVASVLDPVYDALDVPFDPESVGSLAAAADGALDAASVRDAVESGFVGDRTPTVRPVRDT